MSRFLKIGLVALRDIAAANGEPARISGRQEWLENVVNQYIQRPVANPHIS